MVAHHVRSLVVAAYSDVTLMQEEIYMWNEKDSLDICLTKHLVGSQHLRGFGKTFDQALFAFEITLL